MEIDPSVWKFPLIGHTGLIAIQQNFQYNAVYFVNNARIQVLIILVSSKLCFTTFFGKSVKKAGSNDTKFAFARIFSRLSWFLIDLTGSERPTNDHRSRKPFTNRKDTAAFILINCNCFCRRCCAHNEPIFEIYYRFICVFKQINSSQGQQRRISNQRRTTNTLIHRIRPSTIPMKHWQDVDVDVE